MSFKLRLLREEDAQFMLEWMHDDFVVHDLQTDFSKKTMDDCIQFIRNSCDECNVNYAITDDSDKYMGTVSLKHISVPYAEFAITIRRCAMGQGLSIWAMKEIVQEARRKGISYVYWCVSPDNLRALRFYDKNGFVRKKPERIVVGDQYTDSQYERYVWYVIE